MSTTVTTSKRFTLDWTDLFKGLKVAVILPILTIIQQSIEKGSFSFDWKLIALTGIGGLVAYLIKNFFSPAEIVVKNPTKETIEAVKEGEARVTITKT